MKTKKDKITAILFIILMIVIFGLAGTEDCRIANDEATCMEQSNGIGYGE